MINPDDIREEVTGLADEWLARKDELKDRFAESIDSPAAEAAIGLSLMGAGIGAALFNLFRGKRNAFAYVLPAIFVLGGIAVISARTVSRRADKITAVEEIVREQLAGLDPIARAQVLRSAASEALAPFVHRGATK